MPQVIRLTQSGASANIDMLVGDIYGGDCPSLGLRGDVIAASFGKAETRRDTERDGAREREREAQREVQRCGRTFGLRPPPRQVTMRREVKRSRGLMFLVRYLRALLRHYEEGFWLVVLAVVNSVPLLRLAAQRVGLVRLAESRAASMAMCGTLLVATAETLPDTAPDTVQRQFRDSSETLPRDAAWRERPTSMRGAPCATLPRPFRDSGHSTRRCGSFRAHDVALSLLRMVSNNIGHVSTLSAQQAGLRHIVFGGALEPRKPLLRLRRRSRRPPPPPPPRPPPPPHPPLPRPTPAPAGSFIRDHPFTIATISSAVRFYSGGRVQPLFLKHDGFVGAIGAQLRGSALAGSHTRVQPTQPTQPTGSEPAAAVAADETPIALPATVGVPEAPPAMSGAAAPPAPRVAAPPLARSAAAAGRTEA